MAKVFAGMSGGVDSSTSAALLKEAGHAVTGVFIKVWHPDFLECTWEEDRLDAMRVCAQLEIPFEVFDFEEEYKRGIVDYMVESYKKGETPNPDVMCNREIKFGAFFNEAMKRGADYVATGHYAQVEEKDGVWYLKKGRDRNKDQSYFLWALTQEQLKHTLFPIGGYEKPAVRELAEERGLPVAQKKDSQGLCFIGKLDMREFLKHFVDEKPGDVLDESRNVIGKHDGAIFYTLGQRHGFTIFTQTPDQAPHYIIAKNMEENTITTSTDPEHSSVPYDRSYIHLREVNWIADAPALHEQVNGRLRYRQELFECAVTDMRDDGTAMVGLEEEEPFIPMGQSLVLYKNDTCLGGGVITRP